jgi:hypothetical protein
VKPIIAAVVGIMLIMGLTGVAGATAKHSKACRAALKGADQIAAVNARYVDEVAMFFRETQDLAKSLVIYNNLSPAEALTLSNFFTQRSVDLDYAIEHSASAEVAPLVKSYQTNAAKCRKGK